MTDLPPDARGAAPDSDAIRSPAPAAAPSEEPDSGNPAGGSPRGGARGGLARFRALAARLTRPGRAGAARDAGAPAPESPAPETGPDPGQSAAAPASEPAVPAPDRGTGPAATVPGPRTVLPGQEPDLPDALAPVVGGELRDGARLVRRHIAADPPPAGMGQESECEPAVQLAVLGVPTERCDEASG